MPSRTLDSSLAELAEVLQHLSEASETLNARIFAFEESLVKLNPGITVWCAKPLRIQEVETREGTAVGSVLGFAKHDDKWGLWVRRSVFGKKGEVWLPIPDSDQKILRLVDARREERVAATDEFVSLVEVMVHEAKERLEVLTRANRRPR